MIWLRAVSFSSSRTDRRSPRAPPSIFRCPRKYATTKPSRCAVRWTPDPGKPNFGAWRVKSAGPNSRHWLRRRWRMDEASPQKPGTAERPGRCEGARLSDSGACAARLCLARHRGPSLFPSACAVTAAATSRAGQQEQSHSAAASLTAGRRISGAGTPPTFPRLDPEAAFSPPPARRRGRRQGGKRRPGKIPKDIRAHSAHDLEEDAPGRSEQQCSWTHPCRRRTLACFARCAESKKAARPPARHANNGGSPLFRQSITFAGGLPPKARAKVADIPGPPEREACASRIKGQGNGERFRADFA